MGLFLSRSNRSSIDFAPKMATSSQGLERALGVRVQQLHANNGLHQFSVPVEDRPQATKQRLVRLLSVLHLFPDPAAPMPLDCFSLSWNFIPGTSEHTTVGRWRYLAKQLNDGQSASHIVERAWKLIEAHGGMRRARTVVAPASSSGFAGRMAFELAQRLEASHVQCLRITASRPQPQGQQPDGLCCHLRRGGWNSVASSGRDTRPHTQSSTTSGELVAQWRR